MSHVSKVIRDCFVASLLTMTKGEASRFIILWFAVGLFFFFSSWAAAQNLPAPAVSKDEARKEFSRLLLWGQTLLEERDYRGAYISLKQATSLDPAAAEAWSLLGNAQFALGDREAAHKSWNQAKAKDPSWAYIIDKKLDQSQRLDRIIFSLFEFHAQDPEGTSPLAASFTKPFADKKIKLAPQAFPRFVPEDAEPFEVFDPRIIDSYRQKVPASLLIMVEAYSYLAKPIIPSPFMGEGQGGGDTLPFPLPSREGNQWKQTYRVETLLNAKVYNLATGMILASYGKKQESEGPHPEAALLSALKEMAGEVGEELLMRMLDALSPRPDLVIKEEDLTVPHISLVKEAAAEIHLRVSNPGDEVAYNFEVTLYEGTPQEGKVIAAFNLPSLWPDRSTTLNALWNPSGLGYITLTASADVKNLVRESSLANNSTSQKVYVLSEARLLSNLFDYGERYQSLSADRQLLLVQKNLHEKPQDQEVVKAFLRQAVDKEKRLITVFGLGPRPLNLPPEVTTQLMARRNAQMDAQRWLALAAALYRGKNPQEIKVGAFRQGGTVPPLRGAIILQEQELPDGSYLVKMQAPLR